MGERALQDEAGHCEEQIAVGSLGPHCLTWLAPLEKTGGASSEVQFILWLLRQFRTQISRKMDVRITSFRQACPSVPPCFDYWEEKLICETLSSVKSSFRPCPLKSLFPPDREACMVQ